MNKMVLKEVDYEQLQEMLEKIETMVNEIHKRNPMKEIWLDNQDVCLILKISKRTLQNYRDNGILPFSQTGNKIYYKSSDIEKHLESNYINVGNGNIH